MQSDRGPKSGNEFVLAPLCSDNCELLHLSCSTAVFRRETPVIKIKAGPNGKRQKRQDNYCQQQRPTRRPMCSTFIGVNERSMRLARYFVRRLTLFAQRARVFFDRFLFVKADEFGVGANEAAIKNSTRQAAIIVCFD